MLRALRRTYGATAPIRLAIIGDSGAGKSTFLDRATSDPMGSSGVDCERPTNGIQHATLESDGAKVVCVEFGSASSRLAMQNLPKRKLGVSADVVVLVFDGRRNQSLTTLLSTWLPLSHACHVGSSKRPFWVVLETHCDGMDSGTKRHHRFVVDVAMWRSLNSNAFMFFQLDARDHNQASAVLSQVIQQHSVQCVAPTQRNHHSRLRELDPPSLVSRLRNMACCQCGRSSFYRESGAIDFDDDNRGHLAKIWESLKSTLFAPAEEDPHAILSPDDFEMM